METTLQIEVNCIEGFNPATLQDTFEDYFNSCPLVDAIEDADVVLAVKSAKMDDEETGTVGAEIEFMWEDEDDFDEEKVIKFGEQLKAYFESEIEDCEVTIVQQ